MMTNQQKANGLNYAIFGYVFLYLNFNLTINGWVIPLLPNLVGYWFFLRMIGILEEDCPELSLLKNFSLVLAIASIDQIIVPVLEYIPFLSIIQLVILMVNIYFHFQLVTNLATLLKGWEFPQESAKLLGLRTRLVVVTTLVQGVGHLLPDTSGWHSLTVDGVTFLWGCVLFYLFVIMIQIIFCLYGVRKTLISQAEDAAT